ncbi:adenylyl-sulfate kinase [Caballeronia sp. DA-9]|uniref:adenylyl-sulfate kinase n=1 Tax=Caballeronia sp. DA-9 TaxID=3436237 RepID=UPI003F677141
MPGGKIPRAHYARATRGEIHKFTGVSSRYEEPLSPTLCLNTDQQTVEQSVKLLTELLIKRCKL